MLFRSVSTSGNATAGNVVTGGLITATGNINAGNFNTAGTANAAILTISGNANIGNIGTAGIITATGNITGGNVIGTLLTGTLSTAAQPNITSVGTLTSVSVSGNANVGNVNTGGLITATGNITGGNLNAGSGIISTSGNANVGNVNTTSVTTTRANVAVTTGTVLDQFAPASFRTAKYYVSAQNDNGYESAEVLLVQDGTNSYITIYGTVSSNAATDIIDLSSNINGVSGNVTLYANSTGSAANCKVNLMTIYIKI